MKEFYPATIKEHHRFQELFDDSIWNLVKANNQNADLHTLLTMGGVTYGWGDFVVSRSLPVLKFIKRPVIIISPPYRSSDINTINPKFQPLSEKLREEIRKFWIFGKNYKAPTEKELESDDTNRVRTAIIVDIFKEDPLVYEEFPESETEKAKRIWKIIMVTFEEKEKEFIESPN